MFNKKSFTTTKAIQNSTEVAFADVILAQRQHSKNARILVTLALEGLKLEQQKVELPILALDDIIISTDSIGLFEEIEDT
jgi:hypothetical protein